jgi:hypothetical protein
MALTHCYKPSVTNCHITLYNVPKEREFHIQSWDNLFFFLSCIASTGFHRWVTTVLRVYRIHFVGTIRVSTLSWNLPNKKEFDWQPLFPSVWSPESRVAKRLWKFYYVFIHCYIYTLLHLYIVTSVHCYICTLLHLCVWAQAFYEGHYLSSFHLLPKSCIL